MIDPNEHNPHEPGTPPGTGEDQPLSLSPEDLRLQEEVKILPQAPGDAPQEIPLAAAYPPPKIYPEDLQISWSWAHLAVFVGFSTISLVVIQVALAAAYLPPHRGMSSKEMESYLISKPQFVIGSLILWYVTIFFFLYITLSVLRGHSFWETLGWRKIRPADPKTPRNPLFYLLAGAGLSLLVALLTASMKSPENAPIEEFFKNRATALWFVSMAVFVAPLVEETLFRGYLYPIFARSMGVTPAIFLTGLLFGLMHGGQLGWAWSLVAILTTVGVIFTFIRAKTGSVFASFLMHLGYNSLISIAAVVGTHGFTQMPGK